MDNNYDKHSSAFSVTFSVGWRMEFVMTENVNHIQLCKSSRYEIAKQQPGKFTTTVWHAIKLQVDKRKSRSWAVGKVETKTWHSAPQILRQNGFRRSIVGTNNVKDLVKSRGGPIMSWCSVLQQLKRLTGLRYTTTFFRCINLRRHPWFAKKQRSIV